jgi:predicted transglutaminase-like cysteine proteinase
MAVTEQGFRVRCLAAAAGALLALSAVTPAAAAVRAPFMPAGEAVEPPYGYFDYCNRQASDCVEFQDGGKSAQMRPVRNEAARNQDYWDLVFQPASARAARPEPAQGRVVADLSAAKWREIARINRQVNREVLSFSDERQFGRNDYWAVPRSGSGRMEGDCEDYVLRKRVELIEAGVPEGALSIAIARTRNAEFHAVLLIATPKGEFVLDNRSSWISRWYQVNYRWERRQVPGSKAWARASI